MAADYKAPSRTDNLNTRNPSVDWELRLNNPVARVLSALESISIKLEAPLTRLISVPQFNPLYHTGTLTVFLYAIILVTGTYLTMFYQFGFTASYEAIANLDRNFFNQLMRTLHRYASGTALLTTLLHGWRTFFQDRFRGPRWLAWVTGIVITFIFWIVGVTGYWLLWDERAQVINQTLIRLVGNTKLGMNFLVKFLTTEAAGSGWIFLLLVLTAHLLLSAMIGLFFWWHIKRLSRPKWLPPRYLMAATIGILLVVSTAAPVRLLPSINPTQIPIQIPIDPLFLAYLPAALNWPPTLFWGLAILITALVCLLPWILFRKPLPPAQVDLALCDGCILCSRDCPYNAITMVPRSDGGRPKFQAEIKNNLCVSCGICLGSCPENALSFGDLSIAPLWEQTSAIAAHSSDEPVKVVFTCERHLKYRHKQLDSDRTDHQVQTVPLTCVGMLHPNLIATALEGGADSVQVVGCPPEDCANREGNLWLADRLERIRLPRLKLAYQQAPISTSWVAPNDFGRALEGEKRNSFDTSYRTNISKRNWRTFAPAVLVLAFVLILQVATHNIEYGVFGSSSAFLEISLDHHTGFPVAELEYQFEPDLSLDSPTRLVLEIDQEVILDKTYSMQGSEFERSALVYEQIPLTAEAHYIRLSMYDRPDQKDAVVLFDQEVKFGSRQMFSLNFEDARLGSDPDRGRKLYFETSLGTNTGCRICHSLEPGVRLVGPSFAGIADRAEKRVPGLSAEEYIRQSILEPDAYIVEGYPSGQMLPNLGKILTDDQIDDLVAFLINLKEK